MRRHALLSGPFSSTERFPDMSEHGTEALEQITLGGGCFWCIEAVLVPLRGVKHVVSGYMGGTVPDPTYEQVCTGQTGHAEVVQVAFDPHVLPLKDLLQIFFTLHDPTTLNRQGADVGTQYRSAIFYHSTDQQQIASELIADLTREALFAQPIVTQVVPAETFHPAEEYHQRYFERNPRQPYCQAVVAPKVAKLRSLYLDKLDSGTDNS